MAPIKDKLWGFIDKQGKIVIPAQYEITAGGFASLFKKYDKGFIDGLARVKYNKKWGFLLPNGDVLGGNWYENAELFE